MIDVSEFVRTLGGKPVAVFGLGLSGMSSIKALVKAGAKVSAWDDNEEKHKAAKELGAKIEALNPKNIKKFAVLILAPGVPLRGSKKHKIVKAAEKAGVEIIGDIEILHRTGHGRKTVGVTGTNGKSTTTTLIQHVLKHAGKSSAMGGNIGTPVLDLKMPAKAGSFVIEMSSFQLDLCPTAAPDIGVLLNLTIDHIDRHGSVDDYAAAKASIFKNPEGAAVIGVNDEYCRKIYEDLKKDKDRKVVPISIKDPVENGVYILGGVLYDAMTGEPQEIDSLNSITTLHGVHNHQNAAAAYAVARLHGIEPSAIIDAIKTYPGLPHRQFPVRVINGVTYVNDSKATNAEAAGKALACHNNIYWILGGRPKEDGLDSLSQYTGKICHAFLIGEAAEEFGDWLDKHQVEHSFSGTLDIALKQAHEMAQGERGQPGGAGAVLLSPAAASYDQFKSFEDRGNVFTKLVKSLKEDVAA